MMRNDDWRIKLQEYLESVKDIPFEYGQHDCALFASDAVRAMTGIDMVAKYRGKYDTLRAGIRLMMKDGFSDHVEYFSTRFPSAAVASAMPGDLAVFETEDGRSVGVVQGAMVYVLMPEGTLGLMPLIEAIEVLTV